MCFPCSNNISKTVVTSLHSTLSMTYFVTNSLHIRYTSLRKKWQFMTEERLQSEFWAWAWNTYPQARHHMWAVPNGLFTSQVQAAKAKATGTLSGVWDLHLFWRGQFHIIETKVGNNGLTRDRLVKGKKVFGQYEWGERMAAHGAHRHIYRTLEEGQRIFESIILT